MATATLQTYRERADALLQRSGGMLLDGQIVQAEGGATFDTRSPADGRFLAKVPFAQRSDVDHAVASALAAFPSWRATPLPTRPALLQRMIDILREHAHDLGILDAIESGNPVSMMISEVAMVCEWLEYIKGVAFELKGQTLHSQSANWLLTRCEP